MDFPQFRALLATELVITDPAGLVLLDGLLPQIIEFAEDRIFQDIDFLGTQTIDATANTVPASRAVPIPVQFVIIEQVNLITPYLHQPGSEGSRRIPLLRVTEAFIDMRWPFAGINAVRTPQPYQTYFSVPYQNVLVENEASFAAGTPGSEIHIAPTPDAEYVVEIRGTFDPTVISPTNPTTFLSQYFPSLLFSAAMSIATGALKQNFGAQGDDPRQAISWEQQYQHQKQVTEKRVNRQLSWGPGWVVSDMPTMAPISRFTPLAQLQAPPGGGAG